LQHVGQGIDHPGHFGALQNQVGEPVVHQGGLLNEFGMSLHRGVRPGQLLQRRTRFLEHPRVVQRNCRVVS